MMIMTRRSFSAAVVASAATAAVLGRSAAAAAPTGARNVVLAHGLFADGSCWAEVIQRLQAVGLNVTSVQNPLTTSPEAVDAVERVLARQDGPTVLVGHSFAGMIATETGVQSNVHPSVMSPLEHRMRTRIMRDWRGRILCHQLPLASCSTATKDSH